MAVNPTARVEFQNGQLQTALNLGTDVALKLGVSTGGPLHRAVLASQAGSVLRHLHGPLVFSGSHHLTYGGGDVYLMRIRASQNGSIGSVSKLPAAALPGSRGSLSAALSSYTLHGTIDTVAAAATGTFATAAASGWIAPPAPLPITVTSGAGTAAHVQTFSYVDDAGDVKSGTLSISGAGTATTSFAAAQVLSITASVAPVGTQAYSAAFASPADRYALRLRCVEGGVVGVTGGTLPRVDLSLDDGRSYSRVQSMPSTGVLEVLSYAGGLQSQATGVTLTLTNGTALGGEVFGSLRVAGATTVGDVVYTKKVSAAVTVTHVVSGMSTPFSIGVVGNAITVNSETDGAGLALTTATEAADEINAHATASQLVTAVAVGAGTGLLAAAGSAGFANSSVTYTPKVEGVQVRHTNPGPSNASIAITITNGKYVSVAPVTDANGAQTSTATQIETAVNAHATASLLVSADASGSGAGIVGMQGSYQALAVTLARGDVFTLATTPPTWTNADLEEAFVEIKKNEALLDGFSMIHVIGDAGDADVASMDTFVKALKDEKRRFKSAVMEAAYMGSTAETTWEATLRAAHVTRSEYVGLCAGEANCRNPAYGTIDRRSIGTAYVARLTACPVSELPSHVECETFRGIRTSLDGVVVRTSTASETVPPLWQSEDILKTLHGQNFVTFTTISGRQGIYVRQGLMFVLDGSSYLYVTNRRTADLVAPYAYDEIVKWLNANLLTDLKTGRLAQVEINKIQSGVEERVRVGAMSGGRQHIGGVACVLDPLIDFAGTGRIAGELKIVGRTAATEIVLELGYTKTLQ